MNTPDRETIDNGHSVQVLKLLPHIQTISGAIISFSLLLGVALLAGRCLAIGAYAFLYVTVADVATHALFISPIAAVSTLIAVYVVSSVGEKLTEYVFSEKLNNNGFIRNISSNYFWLSVVLFLFLYLLFPPSIAPLLLIFCFTLFLTRFSRALGEKANANERYLIILPVAVPFAMCAMTALLGYYISSSIIYSDKHLRDHPYLKICLDPCRDGRIIMRLSEYTFIVWKDTKLLSATASSGIKSAEELEPRLDRPTIDLWNWPPTSVDGK